MSTVFYFRFYVIKMYIIYGTDNKHNIQNTPNAIILTISSEINCFFIR